MKRTVTVVEAAVEELAELRAYDRATVLTAIRNLESNADQGKVLTATVSGWHEPVRQVRVGDFRVFYGIDEATATVVVYAVRLKGNKTTGEIL